MSESAKRMKANKVIAGKKCGWCREELRFGEGAAICTECRLLHHENCWDEKAGCARPGCIHAPLGVSPAAAPTPVLAAGGIGDGRGLAAALAMGCVGVWVGTRFLASEEGGALDIQKQAIVNANDEDTRRTTIYTGKTSRATYNRFHDLWEQSGLEPLQFPVQVVLASAVVDMFNRAGDVEYVGPFAGQVAGLIHEVEPAARIVESMVEEAADILTRRLPESVTVA